MIRYSGKGNKAMLNKRLIIRVTNLTALSYCFLILLFCLFNLNRKAFSDEDLMF